MQVPEPRKDGETFNVVYFEFFFCFWLAYFIPGGAEGENVGEDYLARYM